MSAEGKFFVMGFGSNRKLSEGEFRVGFREIVNQLLLPGGKMFNEKEEMGFWKWECELGFCTLISKEFIFYRREKKNSELVV